MDEIPYTQILVYIILAIILYTLFINSGKYNKFLGYRFEKSMIMYVLLILLLVFVFN